MGRALSFFLILLLTSVNGRTQMRASSGATDPIFVISGRISLDSLTHYVHLHSAFRFSFNSGKIPGEKRIHFIPGHYSLLRLLQQIRQSTGLYYNRHKEHVIFQDFPPRGWFNERRGPGDRYQGRGRKDEGGKGGGDSSVAVMRATVRTGLQSIPQTRSIYAVPPAPHTDQHAPCRCIPDWHFQAGLFATETLYGNIRIEAGLSLLHLLLSYGSDGTRHAWQIGLGSVIRKGKNKEWQLTATYAPLRAQFPPDTVAAFGKVYTGKGWWMNAGLHYCGKISDHWMFKIGATLNLLKTSYYLDGQLSNAINISPFTHEPDSRYILLKSPYYLVNTFQRNNPTNYKGWVGLTAGIYYNFHL